MLNGTSPSVAKGTVRQGLEDGIVVGVIAGVWALIGSYAGHLPTLETLYIAGLTSLSVGILAYARARQIQVPPAP